MWFHYANDGSEHSNSQNEKFGIDTKVPLQFWMLTHTIGMPSSPGNIRIIFLLDSIYIWRLAFLSVHQSSCLLRIIVGIHNASRRRLPRNLLANYWYRGRNATSPLWKPCQGQPHHRCKWEPTSLLTWLSLCYHGRRGRIQILCSCKMERI